MRSSTSVLAALLVLAGAAWPQQPEPCPMHSQHMAQPAVPPSGAAAPSPVKTLPADQIESLLKGEGMGMAKAAELNHYPGPRHVLQLAAELHLTQEQTAATQKLFDAMHKDALALGEEVLAKEKELDALFASGQPTPEKVSALVSQIAELQGRLRATHLLTHLQERALLTPEQVAIYDQHRHGEGTSGEHRHQH